MTLRVNDFDLPGNGRDQRVMVSLSDFSSRIIQGSSQSVLVSRQPHSDDSSLTPPTHSFKTITNASTYSPFGFVPSQLYNDHLSRSPIAILRGSDKIEQVYKSSTHKMGIHFWSRTLVMYGKRGFKFTYNSDEPEGKKKKKKFIDKIRAERPINKINYFAACGGTLSSSEGFISPPANLSSFFCKWEFQTRRTENQTIAFYVNNASFGNDTGSCSTRYGFGLAIFSKGTSPIYNFHSYSPFSHFERLRKVFRSKLLKRSFDFSRTARFPSRHMRKRHIANHSKSSASLLFERKLMNFSANDICSN